MGRRRAGLGSLSDRACSRLGAQSSRLTARSRAEGRPVPKDARPVDLVPRRLELEPEPMSARGDSGRRREGWHAGPRSQVGLDLLLGEVSLLVRGRELLGRLLDTLGLVGELDLLLRMRVRLLERPLIEPGRERGATHP